MITDNLKAICKDMAHSRATLIAVSKNQTDDRVDDALAQGLRVFGENRVQEAQKRWEGRKAAYPDLKLHLIGPLQTNKVKAAVALFDVIHTVDRETLAREIAKHGSDIPCFVQINTGEEPQKAGIAPLEAGDFISFCQNDLCMNIIGLMCIPPVDAPAGLHFGLLADMARKLGLKELSMGMSDDYTLALKYGATHIRIGSKLFGNRNA